jgi:hypothetical protein
VASSLSHHCTLPVHFGGNGVYRPSLAFRPLRGRLRLLKGGKIRPMNTATCVGIALTASVGLIAGFPADAAAENAMPSFEQYRVPPSASFRGAPALPRFKTSGQRMFRTVIREATKKGPNFAGQYRIAEWGCGTGCEAIAIVDVKSGAIYDGPFGTLPKAGVYLGPNVDADETGIFSASTADCWLSGVAPTSQHVARITTSGRDHNSTCSGGSR